jgi:hypothetical protein
MVPAVASGVLPWRYELPIGPNSLKAIPDASSTITASTAQRMTRSIRIAIMLASHALRRGMYGFAVPAVVR